MRFEGFGCRVSSTTQWRELCIQRLERYYPAPRENESAVFADEIDVGPWVPRELFDLAAPFDPGQTRAYIERFVESLDYNANPFLNSPDEMLGFPDFHGTPYHITEADR